MITCQGMLTHHWYWFPVRIFRDVTLPYFSHKYGTIYGV